MKVVSGEDKPDVEGLVATVGFFDGVHVGHRFLISELNRIARKQGLKSAAITFADHPKKVLQKDFSLNLLTTYDEKIEQLETTGVDYCVIIDFTTELSKLSAKEFITNILKEKLNVSTLLIGYDHRFGHDRTDGFEQYVEYGKACGINVVNASPYDCGKTKVSSSLIRKELTKGNVEDMPHLLSRPYSLSGRVIEGYRVGRTLGFPTANIKPNSSEKKLPAMGAYAVWVHLDGEKHKGMLYIGNRPTLSGEEITPEVNILNFDRDIYNDEITITFVSFIRESSKFSSLDELKAQLAKDREAVAGILKD
jgi:riboflavin kinase/FMN adenylyltransferase